MGILRDDCRLCGKQKTKFIKDRGFRCEDCWKAKRRRNRGTKEKQQFLVLDKKEKRKNRKLEVLEYYGGGKAQCKCCGESTIEFLCIDHINGGGNKHRKEVGSGWKMYMWLVSNKFPEGFRTLCHNCNASRGIFGYCPHELKSTLECGG